MPRKGYRKPANEARTLLVHTRLTPLEKKSLEAKVEASDVDGTADYIRQLINGHQVKPRRTNGQHKLIDAVAALNRRLASIDNNMNQLARVANSGGRVSEVDLQRTLDEHRQLKAFAAELMSQLVARR